MNNKVIYTCLAGNYDVLEDPVYLMEGWDYICFSDHPDHPRNSVWQIRPVNYKSSDKRLVSRFPKLNPHLVLNNYETSIYIDSNIHILDDTLSKRADELMKTDTILSIARHPERNCIYEEANTCIEEGVERRRVILKQMKYLQQKGFPRNYGLFENNVIYRRHLHPDMIRLGEAWWAFLNAFSKRDQLSLVYLLWELGITCTPLFDGHFNIRSSAAFRYAPHQKRKVSLLQGARLRLRKFTSSLRKRPSQQKQGSLSPTSKKPAT